MQNEIPAGSQVKVAVTQKGVTTFHDAEVLAHMDGLVHVNLNGEAVSVDPSQIVTLGMSAVEGMQAAATPPVQEGAPVTDPAAAQLEKDLLDDAHAKIDALTKRIESLESQVADIQDRIAEKLIDAAAPAAQAQPNDEKSTAPAASAEPAGEGQATSAPEATAGATGE